MHPQIVQKGPRTCPICGMALEPKEATAESTTSDNAELTDMQRRFTVSAALTVPLFLVALADLVPGDPLGHAIGMERLPWIELALATPVVAWGGYPFFERAVSSVRLRALNMFTLIGIGAGAAFLYRLVATLAPGLFPPAMRGHRGTVDVYFEAAAIVIMLTGDARTSALAIGRELDLGEADVVSEVLPKDKARVVEDLEAKGEIIAMAGDGINDAPALASASVGIAMGAGSDIAIESAGVTLVKGDLRGVARALTLGRKTMRNIRENLGLAFGYNLLAIPVAAGALYPVFGIVLSPMVAAAAMSFSSVSVITNALRLRSGARRA